MTGTKKGGLKAAETNRQKYGNNFYTLIGDKGRANTKIENRVFFKDRELARRAGRLGGLKSKRKKT